MAGRDGQRRTALPALALWALMGELLDKPGLADGLHPRGRVGHDQAGPETCEVPKPECREATAPAAACCTDRCHMSVPSFARRSTCDVAPLTEAALHTAVD